MYIKTNRKIVGLGALPSMSVRELDQLSDEDMSARIALLPKDDQVDHVTVPIAATPQVSVPMTEKVNTINTALRDYIKNSPSMTIAERIAYISRIKKAAGSGTIFSNLIRPIKPIAMTAAVNRPIMSNDPTADNQFLRLRNSVKYRAVLDYAKSVATAAADYRRPTSGGNVLPTWLSVKNTRMAPPWKADNRKMTTAERSLYPGDAKAEDRMSQSGVVVGETHAKSETWYPGSNMVAIDPVTGEPFDQLPVEETDDGLGIIGMIGVGLLFLL